MSREQAEKITSQVTEQLCAAKESISQAFVSKALLEKVLTLPANSPTQCTTFSTRLSFSNPSFQ